MKLFFLTVFSLLFLATTAHAEEIICLKETSMLCEPGECREIYQDDTQYTVIDTTKRQIYLCSEKDQKCDPFPLDSIEEVGAFMLYKAGSAVLKVGLIDMKASGVIKDMFIEYRPHLFNIFLAWGMCMRP